MKASDVFLLIRHSNMIEKADRGTFDPKIGMTGGGTDPRGYRPATGMVHEPVAPGVTRAPRPTTSAEHAKMTPPSDLMPDEHIQAIVQGIRSHAASQKAAGISTGAQPPPVPGSAGRVAPPPIPSGAGQVSTIRMPVAGMQAKQAAEKAIQGQQEFMAPIGANDPMYASPQSDPHHEAAYHTIMEAHHRELGNHEKADFHAGQAQKLINSGVTPALGHFKNMARATEGERAAGTQALQGLRQAHIASVRKAEKVVGGLGDNKPDSDFDPDQLAAGIKIEREHTKDEKIAREIAKDHLTEDPKYYIKLKTIEKSLAMLDNMVEKAGGTQPVGAFYKMKHPSGRSPKPSASAHPISTAMTVTPKASSSMTHGTGTSMTVPHGYSGMSSSASSSAGGKHPDAIDVDYKEVSSKPASSPAASAAKPTGSAGPGAAAKPAGSTGAAPKAPGASASPQKVWGTTGASATGPNIIPKMPSTTGGPGTEHPGPTMPGAGAQPAMPGAGGAGSKPSGGKKPQQRMKKLPGSAAGEGYGMGAAAAGDISSPAGGVAPVSTLASTLAGKTDVRSWRTSGSVPMAPGESNSPAGRQGVMRTPALRMSLLSDPVLYLRKGI